MLTPTEVTVLGEALSFLSFPFHFTIPLALASVSFKLAIREMSSLLIESAHVRVEGLGRWRGIGNDEEVEFFWEHKSVRKIKIWGYIEFKEK